MKRFDFIYFCLLVLVSPVLFVLCIYKRDFRIELLGRFFSSFKPTNQSPIWLHAASFGEMRLALLLYKQLQKDHPERRFVFTTGRHPAFLYALEQTNMPVYWLPFDFSFLIKRFLRIIKPCALILIETELWFNMLYETSKICPIVVSNARLGETSHRRYKKISTWLMPILQKISFILACNQESYTRFIDLGISVDKISLSGNLKFETNFNITKQENEKFKKDIALTNEIRLFVAGSVQPEELPILCDALYSSSLKNIKLVVIPRHLEKMPSFLQYTKKANITTYQLPDDKMDLTEFWQTEEKSLLFINQMGVLRNWYAVADIVFVGGSFCMRGGQNMIEAIAFEKPVFVGPHTFNFKNEMALLIENKAITVCHTVQEVSLFINEVAEQTDKIKQQIEQSKDLLRKAKGALEVTIQQINKLLDL